MRNAKQRNSESYGGYIKLLDKNMNYVKEEYWQTRTDRLEIITRWSKLYGKQFMFMAIQIAPKRQIQASHKYAKVYNEKRDLANKDTSVYLQIQNKKDVSD